MRSAPNSLSQPGKRSASGSMPKVAALGGLKESIVKELNESLCCVVINASTCLHMLAADPPNIQGARNSARRAIRASNRTAEAVSHLSALFNKTNERIETVAPSREGSSRLTRGGTL
jgi:hypothetical protein